MSKSKKWAIGFGVAIAIAAIVICTIPLKTVSYIVTVPYNDWETYQVQVQKNLGYSVTDAYSKTGLDLVLGAVADGYVTIENVDTVPGTFIVYFTFTTLHRQFNDTDRVYILPGESKTARGQADIYLGEDWEWNYSITPGTKTVTETRQRQVVKIREEIRYKDISLLDYWLNYASY